MAENYKLFLRFAFVLLLLFFVQPPLWHWKSLLVASTSNIPSRLNLEGMLETVWYCYINCNLILLGPFEIEIFPLYSLIF